MCNAGLKSLVLWDCQIDLRPGALRLPVLETLTLVDLEFKANSTTKWSELLNLSDLPELVTLILSSDDPGTDIEADRLTALKALAPQLRSFTFDGFAPWFDSSLWPLFTSLKGLHILQRTDDNSIVTFASLSACLLSLPTSLDRPTSLPRTGSSIRQRAQSICP